MPGPAGERSLTIGPLARHLRRSVGATAWSVLEELLLDAEPIRSGQLGAQASARVLAARLAISKDTAAKALRHLAALGLTRREGHRDTKRGVFAPSVYVLDAGRLADLGLTVASPPAPNLPEGPARRARAHPKSVRDHDDQPSLFELATPEQP